MRPGLDRFGLATIVALLILWWVAAGTLLASPLRTVAISPGSSQRIVEVSSRCPTFSWGVEGAKATKARSSDSYLLRVWRMVEDPAEDLQLLLEVRLPPGAASWTPSLDRCFASGERLTWSIGAVGKRGVVHWSDHAAYWPPPARTGGSATPHSRHPMSVPPPVRRSCSRLATSAANSSSSM